MGKVTTKYILQRWEALELFARLIIKSEPTVTLFSFSKSTTILDYLDRATTDQRKYATQLAKQVFDVTYTKETGDKFTGGTSTIYEFALAIKQNLSVTIEKANYNAILNYINRGVTDIRAHYRPDPPEEVKTLDNPAKLLLNFQDSSWFEYGYEYRDIPNPKTKKLKRVHGIVRQILHFQKFGRAEMEAKNFQKGFPQDYSGGYKLLDHAPDHLLITMRMSKPAEKWLRRVYYIGRSSVKLAVGIYNNVGNNMYAGPLLMEKIEDEIDGVKREVNRGDIGLFPFGGNELPWYVYEFFKTPLIGSAEVPNNITELSGLVDFLERRRS